jgi:uncharacterized membrane protein YfcA
VILAAILFGLAVGVALGLLGGGGSVLAVPVLVYVLGQDVHAATTASLVIVTAAGVAGGVRHARGGRICWRHVGVFTAAALPGVVVGTVLGNVVGGSALIAAFGLLMLVAAAATWRNATRESSGSAPAEPACPPLRTARDLAAGLVVGAMTGFFGVGGGFLVVPALAVFLALSMRVAVGTSLAIITITSAMSLAAHLLAGRELDLGITTAMTGAAVFGALVGAALSPRVPQQQLGRAFAGLVAAVAAYVLISAAFLGGPPTA